MDIPELFRLFFIALASSTLLPGGSEVYLYTLRDSGNPIWVLIITATVGNTIGALVNYAIGRWFSHLLHARLVGFQEKHLQKAENVFRKWGGISLLFSSLPIIGDPITAIAGVLKYPFGWFICLTALGKLARYCVVLWVVHF